MGCVYRYTAKSLLVRRWSQGPHPPSSWPGQISALTLQSVWLPSLSAQSHSYFRDSGCPRSPPPQGPLSPLTMPLPFMYPLPMLCQAHLTFFKMSLASFPEPEHLLVLQNSIQAENSLCKFPAGLLGPQPSRGQSKLFSLISEREMAQLSCETPAVCKPESVCVFSLK